MNFLSKNTIFDFKYFKVVRLLLILLNDLLILNLSLYFSYFLRIEYFIDIKTIYLANFYSSIIYLILFYIFNIQKQYFRYFNPNSYYLYFKFFISYLLIFGFFVLIQQQIYIPRSLIIIFPIFFLLILAINRALVSIFFRLTQKSNSFKTIVFGFNTASAKTLTSYLTIKIFIDDNKKNKKREFNDIKIISSSEFKKNLSSIKFSKIMILDNKVFNKSKYYIRDKIINEKIPVQKIVIKNRYL